MPERVLIDESGNAKKSNNSSLLDVIEKDLVGKSNGKNIKDIDFDKLINSPANSGYTAVHANSVETPNLDIREEYGINTQQAGNSVYLKQIASAQSGGEQALRTLYNFGVNIVGGFASGLGATLDIKGTADMLAGQTEEYGNMLGDWGKEFAAKHQSEIYQLNPGKGPQLSDAGWWANQVGQAGYSLGIMVEALAETAAISFITGGGGLGIELAELGSKIKLLKAGRNLEALKALVSTANNSTKIKNAMMLTAGFKGMNELYMEGADVFKETKQRYEEMRNSGEIDVTDEQIKEYSSAAATTTARLNLLKVANDILQAKIMTVNPMSGAGEGLVEGLFSKIPNKFLAEGTKWAANSVSEGVEEWYQYMASGEGKHTADALAGHSDSKDFGQRFMDYQKSGEIWDSFAGGMIGGVILGGAQTGVQKLASGAQQREVKSLHDTYVKSLNGYGMKITEKITQLDGLGEFGKSSAMRRVMGQEKALNGIHLDNLKGSDAAFGGYMTFLNKVLEHAQNNNVEGLKTEFGPNANPEWIKQNFPIYIKDAQEIEKLYNENKEKYTPETVTSVTQRQFAIKELTDRSQALPGLIEQAKRATPDYDNLSFTGKELFNAMLMQQNAVNPEQAKTAQHKIEEIYHRERDPKEIEKDEAIMAAMPVMNELGRLVAHSNLVENELEVNRKQLALFQSKDFQKLKGESRMAFLLDNAENLEQLEARRSQMEQTKQLTPALAAKAKLRESTLKVQEEKQRLEQIKAQSAVTATPVVEDIEEDTPEENRVSGENLSLDFAALSPVVPVPDEVIEVPATMIDQTEENSFISSFGNIVDENSISLEEARPFFDPEMEEEESPETKKKNDAIKDTVSAYYNFLEKKLGHKPSYDEYINNLTEKAGEEAGKKAIPIVKKGWKLNGYGDVDAETALISAVLQQDEGALQQETEQNTEEKVNTLNTISENDFVDIQSATIEFETSELGVKTRVVSALKTVLSDLKMAFLSMTDDSNEMLAQTDVESKDLLNPNKYNPGSKVTARVPDNVDNQIITVRKDNTGKLVNVTFGEWKAEKQRTPEEITSMTPVFIYNDKGVAVAKVHEPGWYNTNNIGRESFPKEQQIIISNARAKVMALREHILSLNGKPLTLTITEKKPGTFLSTSKKEHGTINERTPQAVIASSKPAGGPTLNYNLVTDKGVVPLKNIVNPRVVTHNMTTGLENPPGYRFSLIQTGLDVDGNPLYFASHVTFHPIESDVVHTVSLAINIYVSQHNATPEILATHAEVLAKTGLDLFDARDLEKYVHGFIALNNSPAKSPEAKFSDIDGSNNILLNTPFISLQNFAVMFGIKGQSFGEHNILDKNGKPIPELDRNGNPIPGKFQKGPINYLFITPVEKGNDIAMKRAVTNQEKLNKRVLPLFKQNVSQEATEAKFKGQPRPVVMLKYNPETKSVSTSVHTAKNGGTGYSDFVKDRLTTNFRSINIGTAEEPVHVSFVQPTIHFSYEEDTKTALINNAVRATIESETDSVVPKIDIEALRNAGVSEANIQKALDALKPKQSPETEEDRSEFFDPDEENYKEVSEKAIAKIQSKLGSIKDLDGKDREELVTAVAVAVEEELDRTGTEFTVTNVDAAVERELNTILSNKRDTANSQLALFEQAVTAGATELQGVVDDLKITLNNVNVIRKNSGQLKKEINHQIELISKISITEDELSVDGEEHNFSKSSIEKDNKTSITGALKRFFRRVPEFTPDGIPRRGFMGTLSYPGFDYVYNEVITLLSSTTAQSTGADFDSMIARLEEHSATLPWVKEVVERLKNAPIQVQTSFVSGMHTHTIKPKFLMWSKERNGYSLRVYDTNSTERLRTIKKQWFENFKQSALSKFTDTYTLDKDAAKEALDIYNSWMASGELMIKYQGKNRRELEDARLTKVKDWMNHYFGLNVTIETLRELKANGYSGSSVMVVGQKKRTVTWVTWENMFTKSGVTPGIFGFLAKQLDIIANDKSNSPLSFEDEPTIHPFESAKGVLDKLARIEKKYTTSIAAMNYRDGGKNVYGNTPDKYGCQQVDNLKDSSDKGQDLRTAKRSLPFDGESEILRLMDEDDEFRAKVSADHIGLNAIQQMGKKIFGTNEITSLSEADYGLIGFGMFQNIQQGDVKSTAFNGIEMRIARMLYPTMSDKTTMLTLATAVMRLNRKHLMVDGKIGMSKDVKDVLFSQLVKSEFNRILAHHAEAKKQGISPDVLTNQKDYNKGAQIFHFLPEMNNMVYIPEGGTEHRLIEYLANFADQIDAAQKEVILQSITENTHALLDQVIEAEANKIVESAKTSGYVEMDKDGIVSNIKFLDSTYMKSELPQNVSPEEKLKLVAYDFAINSFFSHANHYMMFAGDIANFTQESKVFNAKDDKGNFTNFENGVPYRPINNSVYSTLARDVIGVNTGKRLAYLLAPGRALYNSVGDKYVQLFLDDKYSASTNAEYIITLFYGKDAITAKVRESLNILNSSNSETALKDARKYLSKTFKDVSGYFNIEETNAQEYTTAKEALDVIFRLGNLSGVKYKEISEKLERQYEAEQKGQPIKKEDYISAKDLATVFNPTKPVVSGHIQESGHTRVIYVKTSSFALIPQLTQGTELDGLRRDMEDLQRKSAMNVRASYDSGNKVGSVLNPVSIWNADSTYKKGSINSQAITDKLATSGHNSILVMDRENFRIQQDVPFREDKETTTLGTQMMKLFFGDGISLIEDKIFDYNGEKVSGIALHRTYNNLFESWIVNEKNKLYEELGISTTTRQPDNKSRTINKLKKILIEEAEKRGFSLQDIQALDIIAKRNSTTGKIESMEFAMPLWLSPNSNRYESLLNSIVANRMLKLKMPGNSFVAASEAGFKYAKNIENLTAEQQSKIVYTSSYTGSLTSADVVDGTFKKAQLLMPCKFRNNRGEIIDLITDDYAIQDKNGVWKLDEKKFDKELLTSTTFRIPTSGHMSMSEVEIVGFLPKESGDLIILPKNFTEQMGLDFDVDKQNAYSLWHGIDEKGNVVPFDKLTQYTSYEEIEQVEKQLREIIQDMKQDTSLQVSMRADAIKEYQDEIIEGVDDADYADIKGRIVELKQDIKDKKASSLEELRKVQKLLSSVIKQKTKYTQNEIARVYSAVLGNGDPRVQQKVNKLLSLDKAREQAKLISSLGGKAENTLFSSLSPEYQKQKMQLGAVGKSAVGIYSNYVVFHSLLQQSDKPMNLMTKVWDEESKRYIPEVYHLTIGSQTSKGLLGGLSTLDGERMISESLGERQNTALDNEKEQIMGRVGINEHTINVDSVLALLGFDRESFTDATGKKITISIPYFLLSQPIIKEYVKMMRNGTSTISEYNSNLQDQVGAALKIKYGGADTFSDEDLTDNRKELGAKELYQNVNGQTNNITQQTVLHLFLELSKYGDEIRTIQSRLNIQRSSLGKSIFEMLDKHDNVKKLSRSPLISNLGSLVGDYMSAAEYSSATPEYLEENGFIDFGDYAVRPTTFSGSLIIHATSAGHDLWSGFFPHENAIIADELKACRALMSNEDTSETKMVELNHKIFEEMKKYFFSSSALGVFNGAPQKQRARLFFDTKTNVSLASYMNSITQDKTETGSEAVRRNKLLSRFRYTLERGKPSLIKFDNNKGEDYNEEYKYAAIVELMEKDLALPDYNGKPYSTRKLAADLLSYAYLEGGIQEAIQFIKYIPIPLLEAVGFSEVTRGWQRAVEIGYGQGEGRDFSAMLGRSGPDMTSRFMKQFAQHNASKIQQVKPAYIKAGADSKGNVTNVLSDMDTIVFKQPIQRPFIAVYNENAKDKNRYQLYQFNGKSYQRIATLGSFGMSEYSIGSEDVRPLNSNVFKPVEMQQAINQEADATLGNDEIFKLHEGNIQGTLSEIANSGIPLVDQLAKTFAPFVDQSVKLKIGGVISASDPEGKRQARGSYNRGTHTITISREYLNKASVTPEMIAKTILEEYMHSLTVRELTKYFDMNSKDGKLLVPADQLPPAVKKLHQLLLEVQKHLGKELEEFQDRYNNTGKIQSSEVILYSSKDIFEFVARISSKPEVMEAMSKIPYKNTDKTLLQQFAEAIRSILKLAGFNLEEGSIPALAIDAVYEFLEDQRDKQNKLEGEAFLESQTRETQEDLEGLKQWEEMNADIFGGSGVSNPSEDIMNGLQDDYQIDEEDSYSPEENDSLEEKLTSCPF